MLSFTRVNKSFGSRHVLKDLSFDVHPGEIFGFVGSNGAGKTTAMRSALNLLSKDSGEVTWQGRPIDFASRQRIGYMPEERGLYPRMKARDQLVYFARLHGLSHDAAVASAEKWAQRLGIFERLDDPVQKLSLGNQQRVQLCAALVHEPELLILDEPFSGLDPVAVASMSSVLREMAERGAPVMFSSHQLDLVERLCDSVGILADGRIVARGSIAELRDSGDVPLAIAVQTTPESLRAALAPLGVSVSADPLEGTGDAPSEAGVTRALIDLSGGTSDQDVLRAAAQAGPIREFGPRRPHLTELFQDVVVHDADETTDGAPGTDASDGVVQDEASTAQAAASHEPPTTEPAAH